MSDKNKVWVVRVERENAPGVFDVHYDCRASNEPSGALRIINQTKQLAVAGYGRNVWSHYTQEREFAYEVVE